MPLLLKEDGKLKACISAEISRRTIRRNDPRYTPLLPGGFLFAALSNRIHNAKGYTNKYGPYLKRTSIRSVRVSMASPKLPPVAISAEHSPYLLQERIYRRNRNTTRDRANRTSCIKSSFSGASTPFPGLSSSSRQAF